LVKTKTIESYNGTNVFDLDEFIGEDSQVIIGVLHHKHPYATISKAVKSKGCVDILFPWDIYITLSGGREGGGFGSAVLAK
jgi:hypothetical protein